MKGCAFALFFAIVAAAAAQESDEIAAAAQPMLDGVPQVAVVRLRDLLRRELAEPGRSVATQKLAESLLASDQPNEALQVLADPGVAQLARSTFLVAQANAALARWPEALAAYQRAATESDSSSHAEAIFGQAAALRALGRNDEALKVLDALRSDPPWVVRARLRCVELLIDNHDLKSAASLLGSIAASSVPERKERRFLSGRIALAENDRGRAIELFGSILKAPRGAPHSVLISTLIAIAEAHLQLKTPGSGDDYLEEFIEHHPNDPDLPIIFAKLDQLYAAERRQSRHELGRWANDDAQPRRSLSLWYLARAELRLGHRDVALDSFQQLEKSGGPHAVLADAALEHARLETDSGRLDEALRILEHAKQMQLGAAQLARLDMLGAEIEYRAKRFDVAANKFAEAADGASEFSGDALYDVSLVWLQKGDGKQFALATEKVAQHPGGVEAAADLLLERGLTEASRDQREAGESLHQFVREFPHHARAAEAWVTLAELAFHARPPRLDEAATNLQRAAENQPSSAVAERADYLAIWIDDANPSGDEAKLLASATDFLRKYPASPRVADVRLKLAETYFRRQDFPSAQTQFELLAQQNPTSPAAEKAQFFAAQSAMQSMGSGAQERALTLFDAVVKRNGELRWAARNEQAVIERKLGKLQDALTLYDEVSRGDAKPAEKREALCGKADVFYELGASTTDNYRRAIELYDELAAQKEASAHWRNQALFKKGTCLEKLGASTDALATFYTVVEDESRPERQREFFWFYKAGFNAARLLEEESQWQPAAAIYEKLAFAGGARSEEAKSRLNHLRLEHFLWTQ